MSIKSDWSRSSLGDRTRWGKILRSSDLKGGPPLIGIMWLGEFLSMPLSLGESVLIREDKLLQIDHIDEYYAPVLPPGTRWVY